MSTPGTYRVSIRTGKDLAERLSIAISELYWPPADAVALFECDGDTWQVDAYFLEMPDQDGLDAFLRAQGLDGARAAIETVPEKDWVAEVQSGLAPVHAGRFVIHGSHDRDAVPRNRWAIEIDAAQAFGTAHHGTTSGCLQALDWLAKGSDIANALDLGTGTGVLAIATARLWPIKVIASDIDPLATEIAAANAVRNNVGKQVKAVTAAGLRHPMIEGNAPYDLVTANILARPLMTLAPELAHVVRREGFVILSGITENQAKRVAASYRNAGFSQLRLIAIDDWVTLIMRRR